MALADADVIARMAELGTALVALTDATPAAREARLMSEIGRWQPIIEAAGVYAD